MKIKNQGNNPIAATYLGKAVEAQTDIAPQKTAGAKAADKIHLTSNSKEMIKGRIRGKRAESSRLVGILDMVNEHSETLEDGQSVHGAEKPQTADFGERSNMQDAEELIKSGRPIPKVASPKNRDPLSDYPPAREGIKKPKVKREPVQTTRIEFSQKMHEIYVQLEQMKTQKWEAREKAREAAERKAEKALDDEFEVFKSQCLNRTVSKSEKANNEEVCNSLFDLLADCPNVQIVEIGKMNRQEYLAALRGAAVIHVVPGCGESKLAQIVSKSPKDEISSKIVVVDYMSESDVKNARSMAWRYNRRAGEK